MKLPQQLDRLQELVAAFYRLGVSIDLHEVLRNTLVSATRLMKAAGGSIALIDESGTHLRFVEHSNPEAEELKSMVIPLGEGICGHVAQTGKTVRVANAEQDPRFYDGVDRKLGQQTRSYLCAPLIIDGKVIGTAQVLNRRDGKRFSADDELLLEGFARQAALAIENARLHEYELKQQAIESELAICAAIQQNLFPQQLPAVPGFEVYAASQPCLQVGGDYYAAVEHPDGKTDLVLADVSGKGLPAAMIVSDLHTAIHLLLQMGGPLDTVIGSLNRHLRQSLLANKFITLVAVRLTPDSNGVACVVAGHTPPLVIKASGEITPTAVSGPVLGMLDLPFTMQEIGLEPGDLLVSYTDGYSEAEAPDEEELGDAAITSALTGWANLPLTEIAHRLDSLAEQHRRGKPAHDDATLLLIRRSG
jgi:sigma-B regulation protein RsbU (phosphoserine phosphatase)